MWINEPIKKETHLDVSVNYFCNQKCIFCSEWDKKTFWFLREQGVEDFERFILNARRDYDEIMFSTGEPTLHEHLFDYMRFARECGYKKIGLITNGSTLIDKNIREGIIQYVDHLIVSVHGSNRRLHDYLTGVPGVFEQVLKGLLLLKKEAAGTTAIDISFVLNRYNLHDVYASAFLFLHTLGLDHVLINTMRPDWYWRNSFSALTIRYRDFIKYIQGLAPDRKGALISWINDWKFIITDIPFCILSQAFDPGSDGDFLRVYGKMQIVETNRPNNTVWFLNNNIRKRYIAPCDQCSYRGFCEGIYGDYIDAFGTDEFLTA